MTDTPDRPTLVRLGHAQGWSFTPLRGKIPNTPRWQKLPRETLDTAIAWATEGNVGLRTGPEPASGVIVLDVDSPTVPESIRHLTHTVTARTGRGGWHFYFRAPADCPGNRAGILIDGIKCDVRGRGGQVVYPGSIHPDTGQPYTFAPGYGPGEVLLADWPGDLLAAPAPTPAPAPALPLPPVPSSLPPVPNRRADAYAASALARETAAVASAAPGTRNHTLNAAAFSLGQLVGSGVLDEATVTAALTHAAHTAGLGDAEIRQSLQSGLTAGRAKPRDIPPPPAVQTVRATPVQPSADGEPLILDPKRTAATVRMFLDQHFTDRNTGLRTIRHYSGEFWRWKNNRYQQIEDAALRNMLVPWLDGAYCYTAKGDLKPFPANDGTISSTVNGIADACFVDKSTPIPSWLHPHPDDNTQPGDLIPLRNGTLHLPTGRFIQPTPALFNLTACEFDYDPNPPTPQTWINFLVSLFDDDYQMPELLQEYAGYCLTTDTSQQKILAQIGPPRCGKGTIVRTIAALVGNDNVASPTVDGLAQQFGLQDLLGKSVATINDARFGGPHVQVVLERLLNISGEDAVSVQRKFLGAQRLKLPIRFIISSNELPRVIDAAGALAKRMMIVQFTRSFYGQEDTTLSARLAAELPGIFQWALAGLRRLRARGRFIQPDNSRSLAEELESLASPVGSFVNDCCKTDGRLYLDDAYAAWTRWCEDEGRDYSIPKQTFSRDLRAAVPTIKTRRDTYNRRFFDGISLK